MVYDALNESVGNSIRDAYESLVTLGDLKLFIRALKPSKIAGRDYVDIKYFFFILNFCLKLWYVPKS